MELAGGDIARFDEISREPLEKCLLYLAYKSDKNVLQKLMHDQAIKKMR